MTPDTSKAQRSRILALLLNAKGAWVPLPEILDLRISQYSARIHELRHKEGFRIENRKERIGGKWHTWFRLQGGREDLRQNQQLSPLAPICANGTTLRSFLAHETGAVR